MNDNGLTTGGYYYDREDGFVAAARRNVRAFTNDIQAGGLGPAAVAGVGTAIGLALYRKVT